MHDATVFYDFTEHMKDANVENPGHLTAQFRSVGGRPRICLFEHPNAPGQPLARLAFTTLTLPTLNPGEKLTLQAFASISSGINMTEAKAAGADGVKFIIKIDGQPGLDLDLAKQEWTEARVDLTPRAGQTVAIEFITDPRGNSGYDWALWGTPRILIEGRPAAATAAPPIPRVPSLKLDTMLAAPTPERLASTQEDSSGTAVVAVMDENLDLATQLKRNEARANPALPRGPAMVVGEGEDPKNHTIIQVLNNFGLADLQFLAYPPEVQGGVAVNVGDVAGQGPVIIAAPLTAVNSRQIRLFNRNGLPLAVFEPEAGLTPPYAVAVGNFLPNHPGDEIALAARHSAGDTFTVYYYDSHGAKLGTRKLTGPAGAEIHLARKPATPGQDTDSLIAQAGPAVNIVSEKTNTATTLSWPDLAAGWRVFPSPTQEDEYVAAGAEETVSTLLRLKPGQPAQRLDVGQRENTFWLEWYGQADEKPITSLPPAKYMKAAVYRHLRTDDRAYDMIKPDATHWNPEKFLKNYDTPHGFADFGTTAPLVYNPCFTHRQPYQLFKDNWLPAKDDAGRPAYPMLSRLNNPVEYGEFDTIGFMSSTYAYGLPALEQFYTGTLGVFLSRLAVEFQKNPGHIAALEPNHEHEIAVEADGSMGDYNTKNIEGFFHYLTRLFGGKPEQINKLLGTSFNDFFDAPRMQERGEWDSYAEANPFFRQWINYNRYIVNRRISDSFREALLAGFPPELIKSHQIPDLYAIGDLGAFSTITSRLTPIDYAMAAGVGFGFSRYGVWYKRPHDALQAAHDSGFDSTSIGEYQALTPDAEDAFNQLNWIFEHGAAAVHCMLWPKGYDKGFNATMNDAILRLLKNDRPRPGLAGGLGEVRSFAQGGRRVTIASLGAGPAHTGLLKSLDDKGEWTGTVYSVPFHAHVAIEELKPQGDAALKSGPIRFGPLAELDSGTEVEITFEARTGPTEANTPPAAPLIFSVQNKGEILPGLSKALTAGPEWKPYRLTFRVQLPTEPVTLELFQPADKNTVSLRNLRAYRHTAQIAKPTRGIFTGQRHQGGVTFDLLP